MDIAGKLSDTMLPAAARPDQQRQNKEGQFMTAVLKGRLDGSAGKRPSAVAAGRL